MLLLNFCKNTRNVQFHVLQSHFNIELGLQMTHYITPGYDIDPLIDCYKILDDLHFDNCNRDSIAMSLSL